jgi:hypothetical protein
MDFFTHLVGIITMPNRGPWAGVIEPSAELHIIPEVNSPRR